MNCTKNKLLIKNQRPTFSMTPVLVGILSAIASMQAFAAEEKASDQDLDVMTVSASALKVVTPAQETSKSVTIIDRDDLDTHDVIKLDESFRYSAGVVSPYGSDNDTDWLLVRGFEPSVYLDGNRLYKEGFFGWSIEPYGLESVELVKGPNSVLYGESYPGGVVNAVQKKPTDEPQSSVSFSGGNKDYLQFGADISGWINQDGSQRYRLVTMANRKDGELDGTDSERFYIAPSYTIDFSEDTSLTVLASFQKDDGTPQNGFFPMDGTLNALPDGSYIDPETNYGLDSDRFDKTQVSAGYQFEHKINQVWTYNQNFNYAYVDLDLRSSSAYADYDGDPYSLSRYTLVNDGDSKSYTFDNHLTADWFTDSTETTFLVGVDYQHHNNDWLGNGTGSLVGTIDDSKNPSHNGTPDVSDDLFKTDITKEQFGAYAQLQTIYNDKWVANVGGRYDWIDVENKGIYQDKVDDGQFSGNAGLMYLADNGLSPYVSYSESFYVISSLDYITNKLYKPIESQQYEVGVKYTPMWMDGFINLAWFDIEQDNATTSAIDSNGALTTSQTSKKTSQGVELEARGYVTDNLMLTGSYTYTDVQEGSGSDKHRAGLIPRHLGSAWAYYDFKNSYLAGFSLGTGVRYLGTSIDSTTNDKVDATLLWDAVASYQFNEQVKLQVNVNNITDDEYVSSCDFGTCYYGESRRVTASLDYSW